MMKTKIYNHFDVPPRPKTSNKTPSRTKQEHKESSDVYFILDRYQKTGQIANVNNNDPIYGDFSTVGDYRQAREVMFETEKMFQNLPANIKEKFENNPQKLIEFIEDPKNLQEAIKLGLAIERVEPPKPLSAKDIVDAFKEGSKDESPKK